MNKWMNGWVGVSCLVGWLGEKKKEGKGKEGEN